MSKGGRQGEIRDLQFAERVPTAWMPVKIVTKLLFQGSKIKYNYYSCINIICNSDHL